MKLLDIKRTYDYGHDFYFSILRIGRWYLFQSCFSYNDYGRGFPYLSVILGSGRLISINFDVLRFGISFELISRSWFK